MGRAVPGSCCPWYLALASRSRALLPRMGSSNRPSHSATARLLVITKLDDRILSLAFTGKLTPLTLMTSPGAPSDRLSSTTGLAGGVAAGVAVGGGVGVGSGVGVGDDVGLGVAVGVLLGACVAGGVGVGDGVAIGSRAAVGAGGCVGVGVSAGSLDRYRLRPSGRLGRRSRSGSGRGCSSDSGCHCRRRLLPATAGQGNHG